MYTPLALLCMCVHTFVDFCTPLYILPHTLLCTCTDLCAPLPALPCTLLHPYAHLCNTSVYYCALSTHFCATPQILHTSAHSCAPLCASLCTSMFPSTHFCALLHTSVHFHMGWLMVPPQPMRLLTFNGLIYINS